jgi:hypothetical protein
LYISSSVLANRPFGTFSGTGFYFLEMSTGHLSSDYRNPLTIAVVYVPKSSYKTELLLPPWIECHIFL